MEILQWLLFVSLISIGVGMSMVHGQDQSEFISIDCGGKDGSTDSTTAIEYIPDAPFIITGKSETAKSIERSRLRQWVDSLLENGDITAIVDPILAGQFGINSAWRAVEKAMSCMSSTSAERPNMGRVAAELNECLAIELAGNEPNISIAVETLSIPQARMKIIDAKKRNGCIGNTLHLFEYKWEQAGVFIICGLTASILIRAASVIFQRSPRFLHQLPDLPDFQQLEKDLRNVA